MAAFNDATCPECFRQYGWTGDYKDMPPCPDCGHKEDAAELERVEAEIDKARQQMLAEMEAERDGQG